MAARSLTAVVRGRVQGVNFRDFAQRRAIALGLRGYVRNLPDGQSVEVYAEGEETALQTLVEHLRKGPPLARVDAIEERWGEPRGEVEGFTVHW